MTLQMDSKLLNMLTTRIHKKQEFGLRTQVHLTGTLQFRKFQEIGLEFGKNLAHI